MKRFLLLAIVAQCICGGVASGRTVQRGVVREYNEREAKTPLAGVELTVRSAGSTVSGKDGSFALEFHTLEPGERVNVRRIEKEGYVIFNKEAVEQWNLSATAPFVLVMCRSERFKRIRDNYYRHSEERYAAQYKKERDELARLQKEGRLKEEEYRARLAEVSAEYERQLDNLDAYVDRFARIDLSEISAVEQEIIGLVEQGRFDEAILKYDDLRIKEQLVEALGQKKEVSAAITQLTEVQVQLGQSIDSLYTAAERQIETLRLAGGAGNNRKIVAICREIADADTTNVDWLLKAGSEISTYAGDYDEGLCYKRMALGAAADDNDKSIALNNIAGDYIYKNMFGEAIGLIEQALEIDTRLFGGSSVRVANNLNSLAVAYRNLGRYDLAEESFSRCLQVYRNVYGNESREVAGVLSNLGLFRCSQGDLDSGVECLRQALDIRRNILRDMDGDTGASWHNLGSALELRGEHDEALACLQKALGIKKYIFGEEHPDYLKTLKDCGTIKIMQGNFPDALDDYGRLADLSAKVYGPEDMRTVEICLNVGWLGLQVRDAAKALEYYRRALPLFEAAKGSESDDVKELKDIIVQLEAGQMPKD